MSLLRPSMPISKRIVTIFDHTLKVVNCLSLFKLKFPRPKLLRDWSTKVIVRLAIDQIWWCEIKCEYIRFFPHFYNSKENYATFWENMCTQHGKHAKITRKYLGDRAWASSQNYFPVPYIFAPRPQSTGFDGDQFEVCIEGFRFTIKSLFLRRRLNWN